jgi:antitoxin component YwqK of YwqJK toxin-antitoxin module
MNSDPSYISSIPPDAREEDITGKPGSIRGKVVKNYYLGRNRVGQRVFSKGGTLEHEYSYKNGKRHGWEYDWNTAGRLRSAIPYDSGREHGTASDWGRSGALLGSYTMDDGTGLDLWWDEFDGKAQLTEARVVVDNHMDGYEYWFARSCAGVLWKEKWWSKGRLHGIEREWNERGKLRRGFPKYWVEGEQVDKRAYNRAAKKDPALRPFDIAENEPYRVFPPEVAAHLP